MLVGMRALMIHGALWQYRRAATLVVALTALVVACSEPRWTLWESRGGESTKKQSGLERQACETLRDQAERNEREIVELFARIDRQLVAASGQPAPPQTRLPITYRCRRDGEK
jgi:hypothetical protein